MHLPGHTVASHSDQGAADHTFTDAHRLFSSHSHSLRKLQISSYHKEGEEEEREEEEADFSQYASRVVEVDVLACCVAGF